MYRIPVASHKQYDACGWFWFQATNYAVATRIFLCGGVSLADELLPPSSSSELLELLLSEDWAGGAAARGAAGLTTPGMSASVLPCTQPTMLSACHSALMYFFALV